MKIPESIKQFPFTPILAIDPEIAAKRYDMIKQEFQDSQVCYAVKSNPHPLILEELVKKGASFDVASVREIDALIKAGADPTNMLYNNTIKTASEIEYAFSMGVTKFSTDSISDLIKIEENAPGAKVFFRLIWNSDSADWNLNHKFGASYNETIRLILDASTMNVVPYGITFHVGSQQNEKNEWYRAIQECGRLFRTFEDELNVSLKAIDIGGGFPVPYNHRVSEISTISQEIKKAMRHAFYDRDETELPELYLEPGRYISAPAGIMVATVVLRANRSGKEWLYLDVGIYSGLIECLDEAIKYQMLTEKEGERKVYTPFTIAGPTCDSIDVLYQKNEVMLPADISEGDKIYFMNAGAYTLTTGSEFNGLPTPTILVEKLE